MAEFADGDRRVHKATLSESLKARWVQILVGLVALVLAIIFIVENNEKVRIHFVFFTVHTRLWVGFVVSLVLGAILGQAFLSLRRRRQARRPPVPVRDQRSAA